MPEESGHGPNGSGGEQQPSQAELRALATSVLLDRIQFMRQSGLTFGGARDEYEILGYDRLVTNKQYRDEYARGGIAGRIVDAMPNATWRGSMEIVEDPDAYDPKNFTELEKAWNELDTRLQVQAKLMRVDKLAGLSTFAVLLIGAEGDLETELPKGSPDKLLYLTPFSGGGGLGQGGSAQSRATSMDADAAIREYEIDVSSPRFGLPKFYQLRRTDVSSPAMAKPVHWSRVIHVAENLLDDEVHGQPALERVWNLLCDLRKVTGGGAEAFWLRANQGLHIDVDKDMAADAASFAIEKLKEQSEDYKHQMDRWLRTKGTKVNVLGSDVANFESPADAVLTQIAGSKAIPKRILTGSEMGELASSQDRDNWKDQVNGRQTGYAGPYIVRPLVDRLVTYGYLPTPTKGALAYEVRWPQIQTLTEQEKADGSLKWAQINAAQGETVFTPEENRDKWYGMAPLTDEQRAEIQKRKDEAIAAQQEAMGAAQPAEEEEKKPLPFGKPRAAGGAGSGHFGHSGRKGGGSTSSGSSAVPPEPGTMSLPPGMIRGYHYTDNLDAVLENGLSVEHAKGKSYGEPAAIWFSTAKPGDFKEYVEVHLTPEEIGVGAPDLSGPRSTAEGRQAEIDRFNRIGHDFMARADQIMPDRFVTHQRPWYEKYRYIQRDAEVKQAVLNGEHDRLLDDLDYGPAIRRIKLEANRTLDARAAMHGTDYKFSSTQVQMPPRIAAKLFALSASIPDEDLAEDGREDDAHVTVKYGIHTNDAAELSDVLSGVGPIRLTLGRTAFFAADEYDVLYVEVDSLDLHALNARISRDLEVTDTHPKYTPHLTVAYLKKGLGKWYVGRTDLEGMEAEITALHFSPAEGAGSDFYLGRLEVAGGPGSGRYPKGSGENPRGGKNGTPSNPVGRIEDMATAEQGVVVGVTHFRPDTNARFSDDRHAYFHPEEEADFDNIQETMGVLIQGTLTLAHPKVVSYDDSIDMTAEGVAKLKAQGYDGAINEDGSEVIAFYPKSQLKENARKIGPPYGLAVTRGLKAAQESEDAELIRVLEAAIVAGNDDVIREIIGTYRGAGELEILHGDPDRPGPYPHGKSSGGSGPGPGPWVSEGGYEHTGITWKQPTDPVTGRPIPIKVNTVEEAIPLILDGKVVEVKDVATAHTLIDKMAQMANEAKAAGKDAKDYDLCNVSVAGSNLFCAESVRTKEFPEGIDRIKMPQLGGKAIPGSEADKLPKDEEGKVDGTKTFLNHMQSIGMKTSRETVAADTLKASQNELRGNTVGGMMNNAKYDPGKKPIFVSSDNYVLDGHHRWAAVVGRDAADGVLGQSSMNIIRVNALATELLPLIGAWSAKFGIAQGEGVKKQMADSGLFKESGLMKP